ncbi:SDR family oxidoreductase [Euzebya rosea]|uniref:SDR family oxidoreductase n=1 Tax=Euzebya rosea TaxID=2052804 RepID=UPI000D3E6371|nr:SDR family oxidoreductase [Euzebya rosea]
MSHISIIGGHGTVAMHLTRILTAHDDNEVTGVVRNPDHQEDLAKAGARMAVVDLENDTAETLAGAIAGSDAVVFAAGSGPGSGAERKWTVDRDGAVKLIEACGIADVNRYVMVSSMGTDDPPEGDEVFAQYLRAKAEADQALMDSDLSWTIVRPGGLTDDDAKGVVAMDRHVDRGEIPRADVAGVLAAVLATPAMAGHIVEVVSGETPVADAITAVIDS